MRHIILLLTIVIALVISGCQNEENTSEQPETNGGEKVSEEVEFETVQMNNAPQDIQTTLQQKWLEKSTFTVPSGDHLYIIITRGEMPTGGYSITIDSISKEDNKLLVKYYTTDPKKDEMVTQAITKPFTIAKIDHTNARINFQEIKKSSLQ
ncbi:protease complex subunit PrcB family protein [Guptibacillus algicola]|uniref:protease complex subunit PrcB family protein n=1 Tax=Guptibacillus algicola TaxID=225844 RepID=UPI001CD6B4F3|nr:protease complex subunit PrcB family protein [Alkalihalobacillus algicola]MCA0987731.1 protease complex subunit PrcB family protein [Alkalihalobacillus algicola]